jgi:ribonuclease P protein subunit POP4
MLRHELIGLEAMVMDSSDPTLPGISGKILDETRNMLVIGNGKKSRKIPKSNSKFLIILPDGEKVAIDGKKLVGRPEERVRQRR